MNKSTFYLIPLATLATQTINAQAQKDETSPKPNIIFILVDDMGYGDVSALNEKSRIITPNLDRMATNGISFSDAHSSSAVSTPSRYGILTGRYNWRSTLKSQVYWGGENCLIPESRTTIASMLKKAGYNTACIGKWHLGWTWQGIEKGRDSIDFSKPIIKGPTSVGFDYFYGICGSLDMAPYVYVENDRPTAIPDHYTTGTGMGFWRKGATSPDFVHEEVLQNFTTRAVKYIDNNAQLDQPFFLYLSLPSPHTPILPTKQWQGKSGIGPYGDFVLMTDDMVGQVMRALKANKIEKNTILVFTSDNGCSPAADYNSLLEYGHNPSYIFRGTKSDLYEGGHRIPCLVTWKKHIKHGIYDNYICLTDFFATFAEINGIKVNDNEGEDSFSLLNVFEKPSYNLPIRPNIIHHSYDGDFSIRQGKWKLLVTPTSGGWSFPTSKDVANGDYPSLQLFNVEADISEKNNVINDNQEVAENLLNILRKQVNDGRCTPGLSQKNDDGGKWEQLKKIFADYFNNKSK